MIKGFTTMLTLMLIALYGCNPQSFVSTGSSSYINVKDFGAIGDGKTDDTQAIQKAMDYANKSRISAQKKSYFGERMPFVGSSSTIFFPKGEYYLTESLKVGSYVSLLGESSLLFADLKGIVAIQGSFWQSKIESLQFIGFEQALSMNSQNVDQGKVVIENCAFLGNELAINIHAQSSLIHISKCRFSHNEKAMAIQSDKAIVEANWIKAGTLEGKHPSQIDVYGVMHFNYNILVPNTPSQNAIEPAWINNYGTVQVVGTRQGGESGSFTLINNFSKLDVSYPINQNGVIVRDSDCYAVFGNRKGYRQPAVVRVIELPNQIELSGIRGLVDAKLIDYSERVPEYVRKENAKSPVIIKVSSIIKYGYTTPRKYLPSYFQSFLISNMNEE